MERGGEEGAERREVQRECGSLVGRRVVGGGGAAAAGEQAGGGERGVGGGDELAVFEQVEEERQRGEEEDERDGDPEVRVRLGELLDALNEHPADVDEPEVHLAALAVLVEHVAARAQLILRFRRQLPAPLCTHPHKSH